MCLFSPQKGTFICNSLFLFLLFFILGLSLSFTHYSLSGMQKGFTLNNPFSHFLSFLLSLSLFFAWFLRNYRKSLNKNLNLIILSTIFSVTQEFVCSFLSFPLVLDCPEVGFMFFLWIEIVYDQCCSLYFSFSSGILLKFYAC